MPNYKLYCLNEAGRITKAHEISAENDAQAIEQAVALKVGTNCELWERDRLVTQIPASLTH